jgi:hypothetical protein
MDTADADKGVQRVQRAYERLGEAEKKATNDRSQREATRAEQQRVQTRERAIRDIERNDKSASDRRIAATRAEYQRLSKLDSDHQAQLMQRHRINQIRTGIGPTASHRAAAGAPHHGGSGQGGGGFADGNNRRLMGDAINMAAGTNGWVMKLNALAHFGARLGGLGTIAGMAGAGYNANSRMIEGTQGLQRAMGERVDNSWHTNFLTSGMMRMLPSGLRPEPYTVARRDAQSAEGMSGQREEIQGEIEKAQQSRGYWQSFGKTAAPVLLPGVGNMVGNQMQKREDQSFQAEERAQTKLLELDGKIAHRIGDQTAARRLSVFESEKEGKLAANRVELEEKLAELDDRFRSGKIGGAERNAGRKQAESAREIADFEAAQQARAAGREVSLSRSLTYGRGRGQDVEQRAAYDRFQAADDAFGAAPTAEEKARTGAERDSAWQDYADTEKSTRERKKTLAIDREIADFRGGSEARTLHHAEEELHKQEELLSIAKERGTDAEREARVRVSQAQLTLALTKQELAARRTAAAAQIRAGGVALASSRFALGQRTDSQDSNVRFAAGQSIDRNEAGANVSTAKIELDRARADLATEIALQGKASEESIKREVVASQQLNQAKIAQLSTEKRLRFEAAERQRTLKREADAANNETAAMRIDNTGRTDRAQIFRDRADTAAKALEFQRQGRPDQAAAVQEQQRQREIGSYLDKYTRPDGGKRSRSAINREERQARRLETRRKRRIGELEKNGGLMNIRRDIGGNLIGGTDPLTREKVTAEQLYDRKQQPGRQAGKEKAEGTKSFSDIWEVLDKRLPKEIL